MELRVFGERREAELALAREIAELVRLRRDEGRGAVLGLATGRTPVGVYAELVRMHREEGLDFARVVTFNLDEFEGVSADAPGSFRRFMHEHLFAHVNLAPECVHLLRSDLTGAAAAAHCEEYEAAIRDAGGIDLQVLGVGLNGHVGFNEPGSPRDSRTRRVELHPVTRRSYSDGLGEEAPTHALSMGIATILEARRLRVLALGAHKADIVAELLRGEPRAEVPASLLHGHPDVRLLTDPEAATASSPTP
ncbi:MAG: glucosamine-6-phosphate deaminase [Planctomycetota bacterium]